MLSIPFLGRADIVPCKPTVTTVTKDGVTKTVMTNNCDFGSLIQLANNIINFIITISVSASAIMFAYAGFLYMSSQGNSGQVEKAHSIFKNVALGLVFVLGAWLIVKAVMWGLGAESSSLLGS